MEDGGGRNAAVTTLVEFLTFQSLLFARHSSRLTFDFRLVTRPGRAL